jgi:hypothetical protein
MVGREARDEFPHLIIADNHQNVVVDVIGGEVVDARHLGDGADAIEGVLDLDASLDEFLVVATDKHGDVEAGAVQLRGANRAIDASSHDKNAWRLATHKDFQQRISPAS